MSDAFQNATAGAVGAVVSTLCTYPLDVAKTRLQAQAKKVSKDEFDDYNEDQQRSISKQRSISNPLPYQGTMDCMSRVVEEEGFCKLFAGLRASLVAAALTNFVFFYLLRAVQPFLKRVPLVQGMCAGLGVQLIVLPVDMVVIRLQSARSCAPAGFGQVLADIIKEQGFFGLWSGFGPGVSLALNPGITQLVLSWLRKENSNISSGAKVFAEAALAKALATFATYPLVRAKVQKQLQGTLADSDGRLNTLETLVHMVNENGALALFDGLALQLVNQVLKEAIMDMVRVKIAILVARAMLFFRPKRSKLRI